MDHAFLLRPLITALSLVAAASAQSPWQILSPPNAPPSRSEAAMAYDGNAPGYVLFGGQSPGGPDLGDTWTFDGTTWSQVMGAGPTARQQHGFASDVLVLFGGQSAAGVLGDTWRFNSGVWTQQNPAVAPPPRWNHAMAYDRARGRVVLFGGMDARATDLADTWEYDPAANTWSQVSVTGAGPSPRAGAAMAYDAARGGVVLFGGTAAQVSLLDDTWFFDGASWTQLGVTPPPVALSGHALASDPDGVVMLLPQPVGLPAQTLVLDGYGWRPVGTVSGGAPRQHTAFAADGRGEALLFSGAGVLADTWRYTAQPQAGLTPFGSSCANRVTTPSLTVQSGAAPQPGGTMVLVARDCGPAAAVFLALGFDDTQLGGTPLPINLASAGSPNCNWLIDIQNTVLLANAGGTATWSFAVPNAQALVGLEFFVQCAVVETPLGARSVAVTNGLRGVVGVGPFEQSYTEAFSTTQNRDAAASAGSWGNGALTAGPVGSTGRLGSFDHTLGSFQNGVWVIDTASFTVPADRTLTGVVETVTDGVFDFTDFAIPVGETVRFEGPFPSRIRVRGQVQIDGVLDASGVDQEVFGARNTQSFALLPGQPGSDGGPGGGRGGDGGNRSDGTGATAGMAGQNGQDVRVPVGHAYAAAAAGTGGLGAPEWPAGGMSASIQYTVSFVFSGQIGAGGGGGGFATVGGASAVVAPFPTGQTPAHRGPPVAGGNPFALFPIPAGVATEEHFAVGGSGGGGGGSHCYLALTGQALDSWRAGAGGAGGGGVVVIRAGSDVALGANGVLTADGGDGAEFSGTSLAQIPTAQRAYPQPGGGGSGGSVVLQLAGALTQLGEIRALGGFGGAVRGVTPIQVAAGAEAGDGADGVIRVETPSGTANVRVANPTPSVGTLAPSTDPSGARSRWQRAENYLRYEVEAVVNGTPVLFSDDPAVSPMRADDPSQPVQVRFQGGVLDATGGLVSSTPWRDVVNPTLGKPAVGNDLANAFRFDVTLRPALDPTVRVTRVTVITR